MNFVNLVLKLANKVVLYVFRVDLDSMILVLRPAKIIILKMIRPELVNPVLKQIV